MLLYLIVLAGVAAWRFVPRPWHPTFHYDTAHHVIHSTATQLQTKDMARSLELLYQAYSNRLGGVKGFAHEHPRLQVKLFKDRAEFRRVNPGLGWAEAYYQAPFCRAYFSAEEINPYHWMLHESAHQLNHEVAHLQLEKWLEEGLATYFSSSRIQEHQLVMGQPDRNTYPVWWLDEIATSADLSENLRNQSVIPLRAIVTNRGGPAMRSHFNLYYLHWWTLTHFVFESPQHRGEALALVERGGGLTAFEALIGPVEAVQAEWHRHVRHLKSARSGNDRESFETRSLAVETNPPPQI